MKFAGLPILVTGLVGLAGCSGTISDTLEASPGAGARVSTGQPGAGRGSAGQGSAQGGTGSGSNGGASGVSATGGSGATSSGGAGGGSLGKAPAVFGELARLTKAEYASTVEAALGVAPDLSLIPDDGRIGLYTSNASVSPDPVHPYLLAAEDLAAALVPSKLPACSATGTETCLRSSYQPALEVLYRRPLRDDELTKLASMVMGLIADGTSNEEATRAVLVSALLSPDFLFRSAPVAADDAAAGRRLAETLSYALWDAPPDAALAAAAKGSASDLAARLREQATRLTNDARATPVLARFLAQWLRVDTDLRLADPA
ncbi:MAG TPA: DUF1592 domain-containing protein, partial [Polyangiaceae bacterium]|nr:DUF1592 domain-containing protein [Polyangiaceae bacterium]